MKKFSQISQLNDPNKNTVSCDYYDLNGFNKVIVTKQDLAVLHLFTQFPHYYSLAQT